jgi:hypothetical protein
MIAILLVWKPKFWFCGISSMSCNSARTTSIAFALADHTLFIQLYRAVLARTFNPMSLAREHEFGGVVIETTSSPSTATKTAMRCAATNFDPGTLPIVSAGSG